MPVNTDLQLKVAAWHLYDSFYIQYFFFHNKVITLAHHFSTLPKSLINKHIQPYTL